MQQKKMKIREKSRAIKLLGFFYCNFGIKCARLLIEGRKIFFSTEIRLHKSKAVLWLEIKENHAIIELCYVYIFI